MTDKCKLKHPYNAHKWQGDEDLSCFDESFIFDTIHSINRGQILIANGIFEQYNNDFFYSATIEILIIVRSLMERMSKLQALTEEQKSQLKDIKYFRDGLCHTESYRSARGSAKYRITYIPCNYDGSAPWIITKNNNTTINKAIMEKADDIRLFIGDNGLWIKKELIESFKLARDYFGIKLPDEYEFMLRAQKFNATL